MYDIIIKGSTITGDIGNLNSEATFYQNKASIFTNTNFEASALNVFMEKLSDTCLNLSSNITSLSDFLNSYMDELNNLETTYSSYPVFEYNVSNEALFRGIPFNIISSSNLNVKDVSNALYEDLYVNSTALNIFTLAQINEYLGSDYDNINTARQSLEVYIKDKSVEYVEKQFKSIENDKTRQSLVDFAMTFIASDKRSALPYVWGGTSLETGADCSGFVQAVYKEFGYELPRTADVQVNCGTPVEKYEDLKPGDLIGTDGGDHIMIYVGDNMVVHENNSNTGTIYQNMFEQINYSGLYKMCRIIPDY